MQFSRPVGSGIVGAAARETLLAAGIFAVCLASADGLAGDDGVEAKIAQVLTVGPKGAGHEQAQTAVDRLVEMGSDTLIPVLEAMGNANPLAANWLSGAAQQIASEAAQDGTQVPADRLERFFDDRSGDPHARRLAFEMLARIDPAAAARLTKSIDDPSAAMRRDAVAALLEQAKTLEEQGKKEQAAEVYQLALTGAYDNDQVLAIVESLEEMGHAVDLNEHYGFLTQWRLIGPFDNRDRKGFDAVYPPEQEIDFSATYDGKDGKVRWQRLSTDADYGMVDVSELNGLHSEAVTYAATDFFSDNEREIELRLGTPNAWKLWLNGKLLFAREEYHRGTKMDQYRIGARLKKGRNRILLKVLQNEQQEAWAQFWQFQLRVADPSGRGLTSAAPTSGGGSSLERHRAQIPTFSQD